jgi:FkbM family methyltransferase
MYAAAFARPWLHRFHLGLLELALRGIGVLNFDSEVLRGERALLQRLLSQGHSSGVVLDVGANEGEYAALVDAIAPHLQIYAFEPHPQTFARLCNNVRGKKISCHNVAVGSEAGHTALFDYTTDGTTHASLHRGVIEEIHGKASVTLQVDSIRLDEFLRRQQISDVLLLKIDTEGAELGVLKGLSEFLKNPENSVHFIQFEFNNMNVISRTFFRDYRELLPSYFAYRILPHGRLQEISEHDPVFVQEIFAYQNILFSLDPIG